MFVSAFAAAAAACALSAALLLLLLLLESGDVTADDVTRTSLSDSALCELVPEKNIGGRFYHQRLCSCKKAGEKCHRF